MTETKTPLTLNYIRGLRGQYELEQVRPVNVSPYTKVNHTELPPPGHPEIRLKFIVGGGWQLSHDYMIVGGPDHGKRVTLLSWLPAHALTSIPEYYNGTTEEAEAALGYSARPAIQHCGTLHVATIMYIKGLMTKDREEAMARHINELMDDLDEQRKEG